MEKIKARYGEMSKKYKQSIVYTGNECVARSSKNDCWGEIETHHIFYGRTGNRGKATDDALTCPLCVYHHRNSPGGVHGGNKELDNELKAAAQQAYMELTGCSTKEFIQKYGKNYL